MGKQVSDELTRIELEHKLTKNIKDLKLQNLFIKLNKNGEIAYMSADPIADPIPPIDARNNRDLFEQVYQGITFKNIFKINNSAINKMIGENWSKKYLHIFFINDKDVNNELSLVFRFSRVENLDINNLNITDFEKESAYWLLNDGDINSFDSNSEKFSILKEKFEKGIAKELLKPDNIELTYYITYDVPKILSFNGFEQDIVFEIMCVVKKGKIQIGLQTFIDDRDRIHHNDDTGSPVYKGYYDLGNLKP